MKGIENKQQAIVSSDLVSRQFEEIIVEYPEITDREHKGKPYYSIKYVEGGEKYIGYGTYKIDVLSGYIKDYFIPSAQPEPCEDAISRSEAIKVTEAIPDGNWKSIRYSKEILRLPSAKPEPCEDAVSRAEAQTALQFVARRYTVAHEAHGEGHVVWSDNLISVPDAMNALREVPSAQPERKKGKWIDKSGDIEGAWNYCSVCGEQAIDLYDFCPNCGSYNGGEE